VVVDDSNYYLPKPCEEVNDDLNQNLEKLSLENKEEIPSSENIFDKGNVNQEEK